MRKKQRKKFALGKSHYCASGVNHTNGKNGYKRPFWDTIWTYYLKYQINSNGHKMAFTGRIGNN